MIREIQILPINEGLVEQVKDGISFFIAQAHVALSRILVNKNGRREMEMCIDQAMEVHEILRHDGPGPAMEALRRMGVPAFRSFPG